MIQLLSPQPYLHCPAVLELSEMLDRPKRQSKALTSTCLLAGLCVTVVIHDTMCCLIVVLLFDSVVTKKSVWMGRDKRQGAAALAELDGGRRPGASVSPTWTANTGLLSGFIQFHHFKRYMLLFGAFLYRLGEWIIPSRRWQDLKYQEWEFEIMLQR